MSKPRQARLAHGRGECGEAPVLRAFMEHPEWLAPAWLFGRKTSARKVCFDGQHVVPEGELWVFSEAATATHASHSGSRLGAYITGVPGTELFGALKADAVALRVNPGGYAEDELYLTPDSYDTLNEWATGVAVERLLTSAPEGALNPTILARMRDHKHFHLCFFDDGRMISKPGHAGFKQPGVVCVTRDALDGFLDALDPTLRTQTHQLVVDASDLKTHLMKQKIDAVYFNPLGPSGTCTRPVSDFEAL